MLRLEYTEEQHKRALAYVLKALRRKAGVTQEEVAAGSGVNRQHLARLETKQHIMRLDSLMKLAAYYKMPTAELVQQIERRLEFYYKRDQKKRN